MKPVLMVTNAGRGKTPPCPDAKFKRGDMVRRRKLKWLAHLPEICAIVAPVPPGFPPEYALADISGRPRPLMVSTESRALRYIVAFEGDETPHLLPERVLLPTDLPKAEILWTGAEP